MTPITVARESHHLPFRAAYWKGYTSTRSTVDLYNMVAQLQAKGVEFKVIDDPSIDTTSRTGKLVMGILALIAEFETTFGTSGSLMVSPRRRTRRSLRVQPELTEKMVKDIRKLRRSETVPEIMRQTGLSKASVYRASAGLSVMDGLTDGH